MDTETNEVSPEESPSPLELRSAMEEIINPPMDPKLEKLKQLGEAASFMKNQFLMDIISQETYNKHMLCLGADFFELGHPGFIESFIQGLDSKYLEGEFEALCYSDEGFLDMMYKVANHLVENQKVSLESTFYTNYTGPVVRA